MVVLRGVLDAEALALQPGLDRSDLRLRRRELLPELGGRQELAVGRTAGSETADASACTAESLLQRGQYFRPDFA
jgi:hypothetical protein